MTRSLTSQNNRAFSSFLLGMTSQQLLFKWQLILSHVTSENFQDGRGGRGPTYVAWVMWPGRCLARMCLVGGKFNCNGSEKTRKSSLRCPTGYCSYCKCLLSLQVSAWGQVTESQWKSGHPQQQKLTCRSGRQVYVSESINLPGTIKLDFTKWT